MAKKPAVPGRQGDKTHDQFVENLHGETRAPQSADDSRADAYGIPVPGRHRLDEDRQQHDPAEKDSELKKEDERR